PEPFVFEPIGTIVGGGRDDGESRAREFAAWAAGTGSTALLIADETGDKIIRSFRPLVNESFRFDSTSSGGQSVRFIAFEKSPELPGQAIEVDTSRGIFIAKTRPDTRETGMPRRTPASPEEAAAFFREMESVAQSQLDAGSERAVRPQKPAGRARYTQQPQTPQSAIEEDPYRRAVPAQRTTRPAEAPQPAPPAASAAVLADILGDLPLGQNAPPTAQGSRPGVAPPPNSAP